MDAEISALTTHPAHLWIADEETTATFANTMLKKIFCPTGGCNNCAICLQLDTKQHHAVLWLTPDGNYTLEQLEPIFTFTAYALEQQKHAFIVIEKADFFNNACANALLKLLEEPPTGYHFILLAQQPMLIIPTVRSRCLLKTFNRTETKKELPALVMAFMSLQFPSLSTMQQQIESIDFSERETTLFIDILLAHWSTIYKNAATDNTVLERSKKMIALLTKATEKTPMPGSNKLFWKNLFLQTTML